MKRREFVAKSGLFVGGLSLLSRVPSAFQKPALSASGPERKPDPRISLETSDSQYQTTYSSALDVLARNTTVVSGYSPLVLIEGSNYGGIWLECAPH